MFRTSLITIFVMLCPVLISQNTGDDGGSGADLCSPSPCNVTHLCEVDDAEPQGYLCVDQCTGNACYQNFSCVANATSSSGYTCVDPCIPFPCNQGDLCIYDGAGSFSCMECPIGSHWNSSTCEECALGEYQDTPNQGTCKQCPDQSTTSTVGSDAISDCDCIPGYVLSTNMEQCVACALGKYQPQSGQVMCVECPEGTTTQNIGSTSLTQCETMQENTYEVSSSVSIVNLQYDNALSNPTTPEYQNLANQVTDEIGGSIAAAFPDTFIGLTNITFSNGSIVVSYVALFRKTQVVNSEVVATDPPNVEVLKEAVLIVSGNSSALQLDPESLNVAVTNPPVTDEKSHRHAIIIGGILGTVSSVLIIVIAAVIVAYLRQVRRQRAEQVSSTYDSDDCSTQSNGRSSDWHRSHLRSLGVSHYTDWGNPHPYFLPRPRVFRWVNNRSNRAWDKDDKYSWKSQQQRPYFFNDTVGTSTPSYPHTSGRMLPPIARHPVIDWPPPSQSSFGSSFLHILPRYAPMYRGDSKIDVQRSKQSTDT